MTFKESGLVFEFSKNWDIKRYDKHRFYKWLSGAGLKGMDFIGLFRQRELYLMEVKNFGQYPTSRLPEAGVLAASFADKIEDTARGIRTVYQYFNRRWDYRWFGKLGYQLQLRNWLPNEWGFWTRSAELLELAPTSIHYVLIIETATSHSAFEKKEYLQELQKAIAAFCPASGFSILVLYAAQPGQVPELEIR